MNTTDQISSTMLSEWPDFVSPPEARPQGNETEGDQSIDIAGLNSEVGSIITMETYSTWDAVSRLSDHGTLGCDQISIAPLNILGSIMDEIAYRHSNQPARVVLEMVLRLSRTQQLIGRRRQEMDVENDEELEALEDMVRTINRDVQIMPKDLMIALYKWSGEEPKELRSVLPVIEIFWSLQTRFLASISRVLATQTTIPNEWPKPDFDKMVLLGRAATCGAGQTLARKYLESQKWQLFPKKGVLEPGFKTPFLRRRNSSGYLERQFCALAVALRGNWNDPTLDYKSCPCCGMKVPKPERASVPFDRDTPWTFHWKTYTLSSRFLMNHHLEARDASKYGAPFGCSFCNKLDDSSVIFSVSSFAEHLDEKHRDQLTGVDGIEIGEYYDYYTGAE